MDRSFHYWGFRDQANRNPTAGIYGIVLVIAIDRFWFKKRNRHEPDGFADNVCCIGIWVYCRTNVPGDGR